MPDYHPIIAQAVSRLPSKTHEARHAIYERARTALQVTLGNHTPPLSGTDLAVEQSALEAAIERVETELQFSDRRYAAKEETSFSNLRFISMESPFVRSASEKLKTSIAIRGNSLKVATITCLRRSLEFIQKTHLTVPGSGIYKIFGNRLWFTKYPRIRTPLALLVVALVGIFGAILIYWMTAENNSKAKSHSLISPSELRL